MARMTMRPQEFANKLGVTKKQLSEWQDSGKLKPRMTSTAGRKYYTTRDISRAESLINPEKSKKQYRLNAIMTEARMFISRATSTDLARYKQKLIDRKEELKNGQ
ncbi:hypothetical protein C5L25_001462 [Secundilactobacillus silagei JCM 19001]|uniref:HTH merR-type domain-containing protein n=2 Tax=Secundilactobacillus silagei TaxID=1293415 RepID=A0A1Z5H3S5_9LACO|nr:hypothetical protein C5L25_001462 [Secundilactobacillus silagei JCM 19001]GAT17956.1 hypothetical protein IWT126_00213 [Secundilactobacillus silagei JCM 19001]